MKPGNYSTTDEAQDERVNAVTNFFVGLASDPLNKLRKRRIRVAAQLAAMIASVGLSHAKVSAKSGIKPSQLSRQLAGDTNLTLDTISRICDAVGTDFDVVFRKSESAATKQWWEKENVTGILDVAYLKSWTYEFGRDATELAKWLAATNSLKAENKKIALNLNSIDGQSGHLSFQSSYQASNDESKSIAA